MLENLQRFSTPQFGIFVYYLILLLFFYSLKDTLFEFLERQGLPEFKELEHLPDDVLMCHVTSAWKEIVLHQSKLEK